MTPTQQIGQWRVCSGYRVAPPGYHFCWGEEGYPVKAEHMKNVILCQDCGEPAIVIDYWAFQLSLAYCANCAYVHEDIDPVTRMKRKAAV